MKYILVTKKVNWIYSQNHSGDAKTLFYVFGSSVSTTATFIIHFQILDQTSMSHVKTPSLHLSLPTLKDPVRIWSDPLLLVLANCNLTSMASLSRIVLKDCKLGTYDAVYRPSSSFPARKLQTYLGMFYFIFIFFFLFTIVCFIVLLLICLGGTWVMGFQFFWHFGEWELPSFELFLLLIVALSCSEYQLKFLFLLF